MAQLLNKEEAMRSHPLMVASMATVSICLSIYVAVTLYGAHFQSIGLNPFG